MKLGKKFFSLFLLLILACSLSLPAQAKGKEYTYRIRIYAGGQGHFEDGSSVLEFPGVPYGGRVSFSPNLVTLEDGSKYYVKGFRESGKGTEEIQGVARDSSSSFVVTKDQDYVVAYGLMGDMVEYTVNFETAEGETLAPSETYFGNVGDKPMIAYLYIEGYQPQSYNLTKTLSANAAENVFTFIYSPVEAGEGEAEVTVIGGGATVVTGDEPAPVVIPDNPNPVAPPEVNGPAEVIDIDDENTPLTNFPENSKPKSLIADGIMFWNAMPLWAKILGSAVLLGVLCLGLWILLFSKKRQEE